MCSRDIHGGFLILNNKNVNFYAGSPVLCKCVSILDVTTEIDRDYNNAKFERVR